MNDRRLAAASGWPDNQKVVFVDLDAEYQLELETLLEQAYDAIITEANTVDNADLLERMDKLLHYPKEAE